MEDDTDSPVAPIPHPYEDALFLFEKYRSELERVAELPKHSVKNRTPYWLKGKELVVSVPTKKIWSKVEIAVTDRKKESSIIRAPYVEQSPSAILMTMALDRWQGSRSDGQTGSRIYSVANNNPIDNVNGPQSVKVVVEDGQDEPKASQAWQDFDCSWEQRIVHWLRVCVRLGARDTSIVVDLLAGEEHISLKGLEGNIKNLLEQSTSHPPETQLMLKTASAALLDYMSMSKYHVPDWDLLFSQPRELLARSIDLDDLDMSYANSWANGKWASLVHFPRAAEKLMRLGSSIFMDGHGFCEPWIHIIDGSVREKEYCLLIFFSKEPQEEQKQAAVRTVQKKLGISEKTDPIVSTPFEKTLEPAWFRVDGCLELGFKQGVLNKHMDEVKPPRASGAHDPGQTCHIEGHKVFGPTVKKIYFVLHARQSNDERKRQHDTIPSQISNLRNSPLVMRSLGGQKEVQMQVEAETCSSSTHPLQDRAAWARIRMVANKAKKSEAPLIFITCNPDRATRRSNEVKVILDLVGSTGGAWFTQGFSQQCEQHAEGSLETHWVEITRENAEELEQQLLVGRQRALQASYIANANSAMTRITNALDRGVESVHHAAFQAALRRAMEAHGLTKLLLVSHSSAGAAKWENTTLSTSITTQTSFLKRMIPPDIAFEQYEETRNSTFDGSLLTALEDRIQRASADGSRVLVISTRLDRMIRNVELYDDFCKVINKGRHGVLSIFWDSKTKLDCRRALSLDETHSSDPAVMAMNKGFQEQRRAPNAAVNWPIVQPVMWITPHGAPEDELVASHTNRHIKHAQEWIEAGFTSSYQGGSFCADELRVTDIHAPDKKEQANCEAFVSRYTGSDGQIKEIGSVQVNFSERKGHVCSCKWHHMRTGQSHRLDCQCRCVYCDSKRYCPCAGGKWGKALEKRLCVCPQFCNCRCPCCHKWEQENAAARPALGKRKRKESDLCIEEGCSATAKARGVCAKHGGDKAQPCIVCKERVPQKKHGRTCLQCRHDNPIHQDTCVQLGCTEEAFRGGTNGPRCEEHAKEARKASKQKSSGNKKVEEAIAVAVRTSDG